MRVTFKGDYALKAVLDLALRYKKELVTSHDLAKRIDAPIKFMEQVLLDLKKGGFVESKRGSAGGYLLAKPPEEIIVGDILRFIDGPLEPIACVEKKYLNCADMNNCVFKNIWQKVAELTSAIVDNINFKDLAEKVKSKEKVFTYSI